MIAYRPVEAGKRGSNIPTQVIDTAMQRHPDGFGVAWREGGKLWRQKFGPEHSREFRKTIKRLDRDQTIEYVAHFRWATHGPEDAAHSHPYEYTDPEVGTVLVFHNGIIDIGTAPHESDTEVFVRDVLAHLPGRWWANPAIRYLVDEAISWSKLVIMTNDETVNLQEQHGEWDGGIWYSSSHRPTTYSVKYAGGTALINGVESSWTGKDWEPKDRGKSNALVTVKSAYQSAFGDLYDDDYDACVVTKTLDHPSQWRSSGHNLTAIKNIDRRTDGEYMEALICDECHTIGDMYIVDGTAYPDIAHKFGEGSREAEDEREAEGLDREMDELLPLDALSPAARERIVTAMQVH
jgi:hypothetical protein